MNQTHTKTMIFFAVLFPLLDAGAADLRIGTAQVNITPPLGTPMAGYYNERAAAGVHDPLHAKCIVIESDDVKAALVSLDLIRTHREFVQEARRLVQETAGIPGQPRDDQCDSCAHGPHPERRLGTHRLLSRAIPWER